MGLHQDRNEFDLTQPIVSVSLGLPAVFQFGGAGRKDPIRRIAVSHGDVLIWGGTHRLAFHGILPLKNGLHGSTGMTRINLTFRRAT
jgi:alkylated DNA repair protein (DNA oxidative demethylase)